MAQKIPAIISNPCHWAGLGSGFFTISPSTGEKRHVQLLRSVSQLQPTMQAFPMMVLFSSHYFIWKFPDYHQGFDKQIRKFNPVLTIKIVTATYSIPVLLKYKLGTSK